jgi:alkylation response protein AidB-like acyl-CoA dehydrogenase
MLKIHQPGIEVNRIEMLNGSREFCQEYLDDVRIPDSDRIGGVDDGWTVGSRWMFYEKSYAISPLTVRPELARGEESTSKDPVLERARAAGRLEDPVARNLIGEARALRRASRSLASRVAKGIASGAMTSHAAALSRVMMAEESIRITAIEQEITGPSAAVWKQDDSQSRATGYSFLMRQVTAIAGGTTEMSRNAISERILGMPRERTMDKDIPFREVPRGPTPG